MLSIEQRARRAIKKINRKTAEQYPLFADQFAVKVEDQIERLLVQETKNKEYFERLKNKNDESWERAIFLKGKAHELLPDEIFMDYERRFEKLFGKWDHKETGFYAADWWWCAMRDHDVPWCWENCPNEYLHESLACRDLGLCITCHKPLERVFEGKALPQEENFPIISG